MSLPAFHGCKHSPWTAYECDEHVCCRNRLAVYIKPTSTLLIKHIRLYFVTDLYIVRIYDINIKHVPGDAYQLMNLFYLVEIVWKLANIDDW